MEVTEQFLEIDNAMNDLLNEKGWIPSECQILIGRDLTTNLDGDTFRDVNSFKNKSK